ncbi:MAG TPA: threonine-phosphate decarboxylase CobD [Xanthobacteraceae bacterium]|jgi:cobalamin biosynthetic protein CobC
MKHGGDLTDAVAQHGGAPELWLDLSTGINPRPWPVPALPDSLWQRLPSRADESALLGAARDAYNVPGGVEIVAAPGTQALIQWLPRLASSGSVAIVSPTYNEHAAAWHLARRDIVAVTALDDIPAHVRHVVVVNPNNPDGHVIDRATLARVADTLQARCGWLVIDEAFADIDPNISAVTLCRDLPVVVLRSFGKFYGLAGLRLGFAIGAADIAQRIAAALGPWACSGPALAVGAAALRDIVWTERTREDLREQASRLDALLTVAGFEVVGGTALFRLVRHTHAPASHAALAKHYIWSRKFDWASNLLRFGLPADDAGLARLAIALAVND